MKKILSTLAAVMLSGAIATAAYLPTVTAPFDPGSYIALANAMFSVITTGVNGLVAFEPFNGNREIGGAENCVCAGKEQVVGVSVGVREVVRHAFSFAVGVAARL